MDAVDDGELLRRSASGDRMAFGELYERHAEAVTRYAYAWFSIRADVQDIVQDTFITTWQKASTVRVVGRSALPWLLVTCRNHSRNRARKLLRLRETPLEEWSIALMTDPHGEAERVRWIVEAIESLDDVDRRICEMCLIDGFTYKDAAAELGHSVAGVAKRLERAKARIRKADLTHD